MIRPRLLLLLAPALLLPLGALRAEEERRIPWVENLKTAFELAREKDKPILIAINSKQVDGARRAEPAAKELRERTYRSPRVVELAERFVCAFLTAEGSSADFGELRLRYGIDGDIVSPQHIFAYPDGSLISRKEYWPYGYGDQAVEALLRLMNEALSQDFARRAREGGGEGDPTPPPPPGGDVPVPDVPEVPKAPAEGEARTQWIADQFAQVRSTAYEERRAVLRALIQADKEGDILPQVVALLEEDKKNIDLIVAVVRALGRPGLEPAVAPLCDLLSHKEATVRANAAVSLEYIGSPEAISDLMKRAPREDDEMIANHMYRALGRCGVGESKVRSLLAKKASGAKSDLGTYGPIIGLSYFEKDPKTAREVEKLLKKEGVPGGRGAWRGGLKRSLLTWCLTEVGFEDPKSGKFIREELIPLVGESEWSSAIIDFYRAAADTCDGDLEAKDRVLQGVRFSVGRAGRGEGNPITDEARLDRDDAGFHAKGDEFGGG